MPHSHDGRLAGRRVDFCAPPYAGHLYPLIPLARRAAAEGADVRFITGAAKVPLLHALGFKAEAILRDRPGAIESVANTSRPVRNNPVLLLRQLKANLTLSIAAKPELCELFASDRPDLVVADAAAILPGIVCREMDIPWITCINAPLSLECQDGTPAYMGGWRTAASPAGTVRDYCGRAALRLVKSTLFGLCANEVRLLGLPGVYRADGTESIYSPDAILGLGMTEFEFPRTWPKAFRMIGPVLETPEADFVAPMRWPEGRPRVLVTFGTHVPWLKRDLTTQLRRLVTALPKHYFAFSLGESQRFSPDAVESGENWAIYPFIPYSTELGNFDIVVHHGGAGILYACIQAQKPSLVIPLDYDEFDHAARIEAHRLGLVAPSLTSRQAVAAIKELSVPRWRAPLASMAGALASYHPEDALVAEILRLLG